MASPFGPRFTLREEVASATSSDHHDAVPSRRHAVSSPHTSDRMSSVSNGGLLGGQEAGVPGTREVSMAQQAVDTAADADADDAAEPPGAERRSESGAAMPGLSSNSTAAAATAAAASQMFDMGNVTAWIENQIFPFVCLLLALAAIQHLFSLIQLVALVTSTASVTLHLQAFVAAPLERKIFKVVDVLIIIFLNIWALSLLGLPDAAIWRTVTFKMPGEPLTLLQSLFYSTAAPLLVKQWMVIPKVLSTLFFLHRGNPSALRTQASVLTMLEYISLAWSEAIPVTIWFPFFLHSFSDKVSLYASMLAGTYVALKGQVYIKTAHDTCLAACHAILGRQQYGCKLTPEAAAEECGGQCPICQDLPRDPTRLHCGHVFCDNCISEWLDRERTCPMCRCTVRQDALQSYGNGTTNMLPCVF